MPAVKNSVFGPAPGVAGAKRLADLQPWNPLYRVDLAAVVNKYIGETERNLNQVLSRADVDKTGLIILLHQEIAGIRQIVRVEEFPARLTRSPQHH